MRHASIVTPDQVSQYFPHHGKVLRLDDRFRTHVKAGGRIEVSSKAFSLSLSPSDSTYHVSIYSPEDSSDSDEVVTDDPLDFIRSFLSTGSLGDEFFSKRSSLQVVAARIASSEDLQFARLAELQSFARSSGWVSSVNYGRHDVPTLTIKIGDPSSPHYVAQVVLDSIIWDCEFKVNTPSSTTFRYKTDDPISAFYDEFLEEDQVHESLGELDIELTDDFHPIPPP